MKEIWKDIIDYTGLYQVSNFGRIKSLKKEKIMKQRKDKDGYLLIDLHKNSKKKTFKVHRLVAQAFIPNPNNLLQINHIDEIKQNNSVNNLEWCSQKYNVNYGSCIKKSSEKHNKKILKCDLNGNPIKQYNSITEASNENKCFISNISAVCRGKQKTAYGFIWKFI